MLRPTISRRRSLVPRHCSNARWLRATIVVPDVAARPCVDHLGAAGSDEGTPPGIPGSGSPSQIRAAAFPSSASPAWSPGVHTRSRENFVLGAPSSPATGRSSSSPPWARIINESAGNPAWNTVSPSPHDRAWNTLARGARTSSGMFANSQSWRRRLGATATPPKSSTSIPSEAAISCASCPPLARSSAKGPWSAATPFASTIAMSQVSTRDRE
mmetsp:Transcript_17849/g.57823  ORF Transcript_17849/g.57823 Transcript_17849/m.57823 type:complete len:214 (-) Transcript_17849:525-1166(-)